MKKILFGILLLAAVVCVILSSLGVPLGMLSSLSVVDLILSAILTLFAVFCIIDKNFTAIPLPLTIMFYFLEDDIARMMGRADENLINNWLVALCCLLACIAIDCIVSPLKKFKFKCTTGRHSGGKTMASENKYIDCADFSEYRYYIKMGDAHLHFINPEAYTGGGTLYVECKMGNLEIAVPRTWKLAVDIETSMGNTVAPAGGDSNGPLLTIIGENKMGNIEIHYI